MSYTKLNKDIEKFYKLNNKSFTHNTSTETKEEQEVRLKEYVRVRDIIVKEWLSEKKYKELISIAHKGWFKEIEFFIPLAEYFVKTKNVECLKFLCERGIRFTIEDSLFSLKEAHKDYPNITVEEIDSIDLEKYAKSNDYNSISQLAKWRGLALYRTNKYIDYLEQLINDEYLELIKEIRDKIISLEIRKKDLKAIKSKLTIPE